jgi:hypothetical protein
VCGCASSGGSNPHAATDGKPISLERVFGNGSIYPIGAGVPRTNRLSQNARRDSAFVSPRCSFPGVHVFPCNRNADVVASCAATGPNWRTTSPRYSTAGHVVPWRGQPPVRHHAGAAARTNANGGNQCVRFSRQDGRFPHSIMCVTSDDVDRWPTDSPDRPCHDRPSRCSTRKAVRSRAVTDRQSITTFATGLSRLWNPNDPWTVYVNAATFAASSCRRRLSTVSVAPMCR